MLNRLGLSGRRRAMDERGAIMVMTALLMTVLIGLAAYAIDTAIWFVHHNHLQTEADAAALAAGQQLQCVPGTANATVDSNVIATVHQYDGSGQTAAPAAYSGPTPLNGQVWSSPAYSTSYSSTQHNLFSLVNRPDFANQSVPNDTDVSGTTTSDGSPCKDAAVDVKMTETNLPSVIPILDPDYVNAQARVSLKQLTTSNNNTPLAIPNAAATIVKAELIDEGNGNALVGSSGWITLQNSANASTTFSGNTAPITFGSSITGPIGLRIGIGEGTTCGTQLACYDSGSANGLTYTRVWSPGPTPGVSPNWPGPYLSDATVVPATTNGCTAGSGPVFSNFIATQAGCNVQLTVNATFQTGITCANSSSSQAVLQVTATTASGATSTTNMTCPTSGSATGTWTSQSLPVASDSGPITYAVKWTQTAGLVGVKQGIPIACTIIKPCTGNFGTVQRVFSGAYDQTSAGSASNRSGQIIAATVVDANAPQTELMSTQSSSTTAKTLQITVNLSNIGFQNATSITSGNPVVLHTSGNQGTFAIECGTNNGQKDFTLAMATGCPQAYAVTTQPNPPICSNPPPGPAVCVNQNPGNKGVEAGIDCRINGTVTYTNGTPTACNPSSQCVNPNFWVSGNSLSSVLNQNPTDPRLVQIIIVDSSAWVGVTGSSTETPVRAIGTFYITGWSGGKNISGSDPCLASANGTSGTKNGLSYAPDDDPASLGLSSGVLLGHFVQYTVPGGGGTVTCTALTFGDCTPVLTK